MEEKMKISWKGCLIFIKKKIVWKVCITLVFIIVLLTALFVMLYGNNSRDVKQDIESTLQCIINDDFSTGFYYMSANGYQLKNITLTDFDKKIAKKVKFKILDIEIKDDEAIVKIEMEYPDLSKQLKKLTGTKLTSSSFDIDNAEQTKNEFDLYLLKIDDHWTLLQNKELMDVFSGGLASAYSNAEKEAYEKLLEGCK